MNDLQNSPDEFVGNVINMRAGKVNSSEPLPVESDTVQAVRSIDPIAAIAGMILIATVWGYVIREATDGRFLMLADLPGALLVFVTPLLILSGIYGWAAPIDAFGYVLFRRRNAFAAQEAVSLFQLWAAMSLVCGFVVSTIGLVVMVSKLDDPANLGTGLACTLLSQLYGACVAMVCVACAAIILRRHPSSSRSAMLARQSVGAGAMIVVGGSFTTVIAFAILLLACRM
jgi:hypothetical protein